MNRKNIWRLTALCAAVCMLMGCSPRTAPQENNETLPVSAIEKYSAPTSDFTQTAKTKITLFLPAEDGSVLEEHPVEIDADAQTEYAAEVCSALFGYEDGRLLPGSGNLHLHGDVETACGIAVIPLDGDTAYMTRQQLFVAAQALANTLQASNDISGICILTDGMPVCIDDEGTVPLGIVFPNTQEDLYTLWNRMQASLEAVKTSDSQFVRHAVIYHPVHGGKGVICETVKITFENTDPLSLADVLSDALSGTGVRYENCPAMPDLKQYLAREIALEQKEEKTLLHFTFTDAFHQALINNGITRSSFTAALTLTMTTFIPGIDGVSITIGNENIRSLTPEGLYTGAGQTLYFEQGCMRREQFTHFILTPATLYFANSLGSLSACLRPIPWQDSRSCRILTQQLLSGPQYGDLTDTAFSPVMSGFEPEELISVGYLSDGTVLLDFSGALVKHCQGLDSSAEKRLIYAIVNTLTEIRNVTAVSVFIDGKQPDTFLGSVALPGIFLRNPDMIE